MMNPIICEDTEEQVTRRSSCKSCVIKGLISVGFIIALITVILFFYHCFSMPNTIVVEAHDILHVNRNWKDKLPFREYGPHHAGYEPKACWTLPVGKLGMKLNTHIETKDGKETCVYDNDQNKKHPWSDYQSSYNKFSIKKIFETLWQYGKVLTNQILNFQGDHTSNLKKTAFKQIQTDDPNHVALYSRKESIGNSKQLILNQQFRKEKLPILHDGIRFATSALNLNYDFNGKFSYLESDEETEMFMLPSEHSNVQQMNAEITKYLFGIKKLKMIGLSYERLTVNSTMARFINGEFTVPIGIKNLTVTGKLVKYAQLDDVENENLGKGIEISFWLKLDGLSNNVVVSHRYYSPSPSSVSLSIKNPWHAKSRKLFYSQYHRIPFVVKKLFLHPLRSSLSLLIQNHIENTLQKDILKSLSAFYSQQFDRFQFYWLKNYLLSPDEAQDPAIIQDLWMKNMIQKFTDQAQLNKILPFQPRLLKQQPLPKLMLNSTLSFQHCFVDLSAVHFQIRGPFVVNPLSHEDSVSIIVDSIAPVSCNLGHVGNHFFPSSSIWRSQLLNVSTHVGLFLEIQVPKKVIFDQHFDDPLVDFQFHYYPDSLVVSPSTSSLSVLSKKDSSISPFLLSQIHKKLSPLLQSRLLFDLRHTIYSIYFNR